MMVKIVFDLLQLSNGKKMHLKQKKRIKSPIVLKEQKSQTKF